MVRYDLRSFRSLDTIIVLTVIMLFISGFTIYILKKPVRPFFSISDVSFLLSEDKRSIVFNVSVKKGSIELGQLYLNNISVYNWSSDKRIVNAGDEVQCIINYEWRMNKEYTLKMLSNDGRLAEFTATAPEFTPSLIINIKDMNVTLDSEFLKLKVSYNAECKNIDDLHLLLFTYRTFERPNRDIYIFFDRNFMTDESMKRAETIIRYFGIYNIKIFNVNYAALESLSKVMPNVMLIIVNPLKDSWGRNLGNAIPAPLVDSDKDGYIKDNSKYNKSFLFDWMKDQGLILVTVGSLQPYKKIISDDGLYTYAKDTEGLFDARVFLTDASGEESIIKGGFTLGDYTPVRISSSLGLPYREASFGFDKDAMEKYGLQYYAYGDYELSYKDQKLNLTLPVYIRVGEGGWLAFGDEEFWLSDEQLAHDLFMIYMQAVWNSEWVPYGWYWDSSSAFHESHGLLRVEGSLVTEFIPSNIIDEKIIVRVIGIAFLSDLNEGIIFERVLDYQIP